MLDYATAVYAHSPRCDEVGREQSDMAFLREIAEQRIAGRGSRSDFQRAIVYRLDKPGLPRDDGSPHAAVAIYSSDDRHLPEFKKAAGARRQMIDDTFADVLRDVAHARGEP